MMRLSLSGVVAASLLWALTALGQEEQPEPNLPTQAMTLDRLDVLIRRIDEDAKRPEFNVWEFVVAERPVMVITDPGADRMRIMSPIDRTSILTHQLLVRMMQANFDSALDARYAIAQEIIWGVFIHPLSELTDRLFLSGVGQVINVAATFGSSYSSGALIYGGGDSDELQRKLLEDLEGLGDDST